jgi:hypothetical protein
MRHILQSAVLAFCRSRGQTNTTNNAFMKKTLQQLLCAGLGAAILAATTASAQPAKPKATDAKAVKSEDAPKRDWYPFYGTVTNVDLKAKTVSLRKTEGMRVLKTDDKTTLEKNDKPATLADIKPGNYLHGKLHKEGGTEEFILDAKIEKEAPIHTKGSSKMDKEKPVVTPAAPAMEETVTNAPAKKKKKTATQ